MLLFDSVLVLVDFSRFGGFFRFVTSAQTAGGTAVEEGGESSRTTPPRPDGGFCGTVLLLNRRKQHSRTTDKLRLSLRCVVLKVAQPKAFERSCDKSTLAAQGNIYIDIYIHNVHKVQFAPASIFFSVFV